MKSILLFLCVGILALVSAQNSMKAFTATIKIYDDPVLIGTVTGKISYNSSSDGSVVQKRTDYNLGPTEYIFWTASSSVPSIRYQKCADKCDAETYSKPVEHIFVKSSDTVGPAVTIDSRSCITYNRAGADAFSVQTLYADSTGAPCRAIYGNGKKVDFSHVSPNMVSIDAFEIKQEWNCPQPVCNVQLDIIYVFDESGSISANDWIRMKAFGINLTNSFTIGSNAVQVGIVFFDDDARRIMPVSNDRLSINNAMNTSSQGRGNTCISCGLNMAADMFPATRGGVPVQRIVIAMTDGKSNVQSNQNQNAATRLENMGVITFVIAVGSRIDANELQKIATTTPRAQTYWTAAGYQQLGGILSGITAESCLALPGSPCGANCRGFCGCGGQCMCADTCDDANPCTVDTCTNANGWGCVYSRKPCDDLNACTADSCNPSTANGCVFSPVDVEDFCDDNKLCTLDLCTASLGCQNPPVDCDDRKPCTADSCNPSNGQCVHTPIPSCLCAQEVVCPFINNCTNHACDPTTGQCKTTPIVCNDNNICTDDTCNPTSGCVFTPKDCSDGNACTTDTCDPSNLPGGCLSTTIDPATYDDLDACTTDYCNTTTGIQHDRITCRDEDSCTEDNVCESITGCVFRQKNCGEILGDKISSQCKIALCNSNDTTGEGCYVGEADGAEYDTCGVCFGHGLTCLSATTIGIGVGAAVGIAVGAVAFAALVGAGGYKGMKYYQSLRTPMGEAASNPLYDDTVAGRGENPMFTEEMQPK